MNFSTELQNEIEAFLHRSMQTWNIPGLGLTIVEGDKPLLEKGYGVREAGKPEPVDEHTLFAIDSNTKAFTATAIGMLVQQGKLNWDDPVLGESLISFITDGQGHVVEFRVKIREDWIDPLEHVFKKQ